MRAKNEDKTDSAALLPGDALASLATTEALPNTGSRPTPDRLQGLILFIGGKADTAEQAAQSRRYYAKASDGMSAEDIEAAHALAEQIAGRAIHKPSAKEERQWNARDLRIADKCEKEARMLREVASALQLLMREEVEQRLRASGGSVERFLADALSEIGSGTQPSDAKRAPSTRRSESAK